MEKDIAFMANLLCVPNSKTHEIFCQFSSVLQQQKALIQYWMEHDPEASWRGLIVILDSFGSLRPRKVADTIRHLAEPVTGSRDCVRDLVICTVVCIPVLHSYVNKYN